MGLRDCACIGICMRRRHNLIIKPMKEVDLHTLRELLTKIRRELNVVD